MRAVFEFTPSGFHYNPIGSVHGGVCATMCDSACGCAVHSMLPAGAFYTSLDLSVKFIRPVTASTGRLLCEGTVEHFVRTVRAVGLPTRRLRSRLCRRLPARSVERTLCTCGRARSSAR